MDFSGIGMWCLSFVGGLGIGILFYWGLWWTIATKFSSKHPLFWWLTSFIVRIIATASVFYWIANEYFIRYIFLFFGFVLSKRMVVKMKSRAERRSN